MKKKTKINTAEIIVMGFFLIVCLLLFIDGKIIKPISSDAMRFPGVIMIGIVVLSVVEVLTKLLNGKDARKQEKETGREEAEVEESGEKLFKNPKNFLIALGMTVAYMGVIYILGFLVASIVFGICFGLVYQYKKKILLVIYSCLVSSLLYLVFSFLLKIKLPNGLLIDLIIR